MKKYIILLLVLFSGVSFADVHGKYITGEDYTPAVLQPLTAASAIIFTPSRRPWGALISLSWKTANTTSAGQAYTPILAKRPAKPA